MIIWIDGDACPRVIKDIIFKAANRTKTKTILVANQFINLPPSPMIKRHIVEQGFDKADKVIEDSVISGDIVVTSDLALAEGCLKKQAHVISPRGEQFSTDSIKQKLTIRDFNELMRSSGLHSGGPRALSSRETHLFAGQLDRLLAKK